MVLFTRVPVTPDYWGHVLPGLLVTGLGLGLIFAPAIASATSGVKPDDAGAASATVNTFQQIGGSIGTALLNTIAVTVTMRALPSATDNESTISHAIVHGYSVAFWWAALFFGLGAIISLFMLESGPTQSYAGLEATN
jgi:hypothetical protein